MVDSRVLDAVRELLHGRHLCILITGGTGFVGSRLAILLAESDQIVTVTGRNRYRSGVAWHRNVRFVPSDICIASDVARVCRDQDVVVHTAALASTWGKPSRFHAVNVRGTENVVLGCQQQPNTRLIHVSSTAIHFEFRDKLSVQENEDLPRRFACEYAKSKAASEKVVQQAVTLGLNAMVVRARAVFGPGDNALLPRILVAASRGRLPIIGRGNNRVDLTYIDNLTYALCLAMVEGEPGSVCTITNEEPVLLWDILNRIFAKLDFPTLRRRLPYSAAMAIALTGSLWHSCLGRKGEPTLTAYGIGLLSKSQTFSPDAARRVLGYRPIVSMEQAVSHTLEWLNARNDSDAKCSAQVKLFTTGYTPQPYFLAERGRGRNKTPFHATCALIHHPLHGMFLFDTGYSPRFAEATRSFPYNIYGLLSPIVHSPSLTIRSQLAEQGVTPEQIRGVIISHFHADHVAGLRDFEHSDLIASQQAWSDVEGRRGISALRRGILPSLLPSDFEARFRPIDHFHDPGIGPFEHCHDLFGDGSVRIIPIPGHACGQIGALVQTGPGKRVFLAADATWTLGSLRANRLPHWLTYSFIDSIPDLKMSLDQLHVFSELYPSIEIIPTHCPEVARRYEFGRIVKERMSL